MALDESALPEPLDALRAGDGVSGHEILPIGGQGTACWWPSELPTGGQWDCPR